MRPTLVSVLRLIAVLVVLAACLPAGCGSGEGFKDPDKLAGSIKEKGQARIAKDPDTFGRGTKVKGLTCVEDRDRVFKCAGELSTGDRYSTTATVSKDGKHYVTD